MALSVFQRRINPETETLVSACEKIDKILQLPNTSLQFPPSCLFLLFSSIAMNASSPDQGKFGACEYHDESVNI